MHHTGIVSPFLSKNFKFCKDICENMCTVCVVVDYLPYLQVVVDHADTVLEYSPWLNGLSVNVIVVDYVNTLSTDIGFSTKSKWWFMYNVLYTAYLTATFLYKCFWRDEHYFENFEILSSLILWESQWTIVMKMANVIL